MHFNMLDAKTQLSRLVEAALRGEEVIIANRGKPMVKLVPAEPAQSERQFGTLAGIWTTAEIDAAFSPEADAQAAADLMDHAERRAWRVMEPVRPFRDEKPAPKPAIKAPRKTAARAKPTRRTP